MCMSTQCCRDESTAGSHWESDCGRISRSRSQLPHEGQACSLKTDRISNSSTAPRTRDKL